jgi:hypothetical protein
MKCSKHNIEYFSSCHLCEQEKHYKAVERRNKVVENSLAAEEARAQAAKFEKQQQEREAAQSAIKTIFINLIPIIHEMFGDNFLARYYLRLTLDADDKLGGNLIGELIRDVLAQDMSQENRNLIELQESLKKTIVQKSDDSYEIINSIREKNDSIKSVISATSYFLALLVAFIWGLINTTGSFIIFKTFIWMAALLFGLLGGFLLAKIIERIIFGDKATSDWFLDRYDEIDPQLENFTPWYVNEKILSQELTKSIAKGTPFVVAFLKKWESPDQTVSRVIEAEINQVVGYNYKFPGDNSVSLEKEKNNSHVEIIVDSTAGTSLTSFCEECGSKQSIPQTKFCENCGNIFY